jgi:hypothetical protein
MGGLRQGGHGVIVRTRGERAISKYGILSSLCQVELCRLLY